MTVPGSQTAKSLWISFFLKNNLCKNVILFCVVIGCWDEIYMQSVKGKLKDLFQYMCKRSWLNSKQLLWCQTMLFHLFYGLSLLWDRNGGGGRMGHNVLLSVKALIISALLVLVAWLRWKANTGSPPLLSRTLSIQGGSVPGLNAGGPFSWKWLGHCGVSGF